MKTRVLTAAVLLISGYVGLPAESDDGKVLPFPIESVVLYSDRAVVRRAADVPLKAGLNRITYRGPAVKLKSETLTGFCGASNCIVQSIWTRTDKSAESLDGRLAALEQERKELQKALDANTRSSEKLETLNRLNDRFLQLLLEGISDSAFERATANVDWQATRRKVAASSDEIQLQIQSLLRKRDDLKERLDLVESRIDQIATSTADELRVVELTVYVPEASRARIGFDYMVEDASWSVSYNLEYRKGARTMPGKLVGLIQQNSGEDWVNVKMELSTEQPDRGGSRPLLSAIQVHAYEVAANTDIVSADNEISEEADGRTSEESSISEKQVRFAVPDRVSIPSGKRYQRISVASLSLEVKQEHLRIVGQISSNAHRALQLLNRSTFSLLPGKGYIYGPDGYMGMTYLDYTPPGAELMAGLGVSGDVRVKRKIYHRQEKAGLISSTRLYQTEVTLELENPTAASQEVRIFERVPVTATEKVKIRLLEKTTKGFKELRANTGILVWSIDLKAGETKKVVLHYEVEVPEGISGNFYGK
ncbi:MAG: mucoidy inhibitor MuiA family protein [Leptospiraceae bacterium]|nr:mucoidy inhibitor MuiA family protein [Leptospiraceae bacterium]